MAARSAQPSCRVSDRKQIQETAGQPKQRQREVVEWWETEFIVIGGVCGSETTRHSGIAAVPIFPYERRRPVHGINTPSLE